MEHGAIATDRDCQISVVAQRLFCNARYGQVKRKCVGGTYIYAGASQKGRKGSHRLCDARVSLPANQGDIPEFSFHRVIVADP